MKRVLMSVLFIMLCIFAVGCGKTSVDADMTDVNDATNNLDKNSVIGKWKCELYASALIIEFTEDGRYISYNDKGGFVDYSSYGESNYRIDGNNIITYVDGVSDSEIELEASVNGNKLLYGGVEYERFVD